MKNIKFNVLDTYLEQNGGFAFVDDFNSGCGFPSIALDSALCNLIRFVVKFELDLIGRVEGDEFSPVFVLC